jgi:hypothetical protein
VSTWIWPTVPAAEKVAVTVEVEVDPTFTGPKLACAAASESPKAKTPIRKNPGTRKEKKRPALTQAGPIFAIAGIALRNIKILRKE